MTDYSSILRVLRENDVDFVLVGGAAAIAHGAARLTLDVDIVYDRSKENLQRIVQALAPYHPYPRGAPAGLPFQFDVKTLENGLNFTLRMDLGDLDILGEIAGGGTYDDLLPLCIRATAFGIECACLDLEHLIRAKRAAGRPKDFEAIAELEAILEERGEQSS